ncbi:MAG: type II toxin-antitoxin system VapC family toxin [Proteobacteria bacterium]|nr:type II toxin-antitoxin system VapC family toxin [Pseudomonadota bacterium]MBI3499376.1 type II toxin-antitoxin system VapC family toxin [Pseudomonadota bacterium]
MIVLDTNVLSETLRAKPADSVKRWMREQPSQSLFTTSVCEAEMFYGLALLAKGRRRSALEAMVQAIFAEGFAGRVLPFDSAAARAFAEIAANRQAEGRPISEFDAEIAAIARSRGAALATRNLDDFAGCGIELISPWSE